MKKQIATTYLFILLLVALQGCDRNSVGEPVRKVSLFNTGWKFILGDDPRSYIESFDDAAWSVLNLPHDWNIETGLTTGNAGTSHGGIVPGSVGWYRKTFTADMADKEKNTYIDFDGICWNSSVWINGNLLNERQGDSPSSRFNLTPYLKYGQKNTIAVRVDTSMQPDSLRHTGAGLYRNVRLVTVNSLHVAHWDTSVTIENVTTESADVNLRITLENNSKEVRDAELMSVITDADGIVKARVSSRISVPKEEKQEMVQVMKLEKPVLGSDTHLYMYQITTQVIENGQVVDDYNTSLGIRSF